MGGIVVFLLGSTLSLLFYKYHKTMKSPAKQWSRRLGISLMLFALGGIGVIIDSISDSKLWFLGAIPITLSYLLAISASFHYIRRLSAAAATPPEPEAESPRLPPAAYLTRKDPRSLRELLMLMKENSSGLVVIDREPEEIFIRNTGIKPDRYIWLSRTGSSKSVDPSKLHMLQEEVLRFVSGEGGRVVVYLGGLDYLLLYNDFKSVARFLLNLKDHLMMKASLLIIHLPERTVNEIQESSLMREFEWLDEGRMLSEIEEIALFGIMKREGPPNAGGEGSEARGRTHQETP